MSADLEEKLYDLVATEIARGDLKQGLWLKAFAEVQGEKQGPSDISMGQ